MGSYDRFVDDEDDDDLDVLADGQSVKVPLYLCDEAVQRAIAGVDLRDHQPGFRYATDAARAVVRDARNEMIRRAENAWRTPRDAAEPDAAVELLRRRVPAPHDDPSGAMRGHLEPDAAAAAREKAWRARCVALENAWRSPIGRTDPDAAFAIEHRRRVYTHEASR
jgi:hypothetical protein